ncbi:MAG: protein tyrosine phosphatase [Chloroflexi bacterium RBG_19FT_COMBO_56_12]|nr:MAG: protein tyrosine phosphatase [Chloroflexi bacterium RBG_16_58_14]OGO71993.1 MAG: protein tyrosine phosphatase [Chloroflexi bacterium RBG_19FT_COMBO_56_12]
MDKIRVLFLCTGNTARSQMAEAWLKFYATERFEVYSAGLEPSVVNPLTIQVMQEAGVDMSEARSKNLTEFIGKLHFGYMITVCSNAEAKCPIFPGVGVRLHWPFDDPAAVAGTDEEKLAAFRRVRDEIEQKVKSWLYSLGTEQFLGAGKFR